MKPYQINIKKDLFIIVRIEKNLFESRFSRLYDLFSGRHYTSDMGVKVAKSCFNIRLTIKMNFKTTINLFARPTYMVFPSDGKL